MGDRANIVFNTRGVDPRATTLKQAMQGAIVLYSHWGGEDLGPDLVKALAAAKPRWSDESYATRIIVSRIVGEEWTSETGFGLSVGTFCDNGRPVLVVDFTHQQVLVYREDDDSLPERVMSFDAFTGMSESAARYFHLNEG